MKSNYSQRRRRYINELALSHATRTPANGNNGKNEEKKWRLWKVCSGFFFSFFFLFIFVNYWFWVTSDPVLLVLDSDCLRWRWSRETARKTRNKLERYSNEKKKNTWFEAWIKWKFPISIEITRTNTRGSPFDIRSIMFVNLILALRRTTNYFRMFSSPARPECVGFVCVFVVLLHIFCSNRE